MGKPRKEQFQVIVEFTHRPHGGTRGAHRIRLVDGNGRRNPLDAVHPGTIHAIEKLSGVGAEGFHVTPLSLGIHRVERQGGFAAAADPGHDGHLPQGQVETDVFEVILRGALDANSFHLIGGHGRHNRLHHDFDIRHRGVTLRHTTSGKIKRETRSGVSDPGRRQGFPETG